MNILVASAEGVAVSAVAVLIGYWAFRRRALVAAGLPVLSVLSLDLAVPCQVFETIVSRFDPVAQAGWWLLPLWWALFTALGGVFAACGAVLFPRAVRREAAAGLFYPNAIFVPLIILSQLFGSDSREVVELFLLTLFFPAFFFSTAPVLLSGRRGTPLRWTFTPVLAATLLAVAIKYLGLDVVVPRFVLSALKLIGAMAVPALLLYLGGSLALSRQVAGTAAVAGWTVWLFVALKNVAFPCLVVLLLRWIQPAGNIALLLVLLAAVPPITALPVLVRRAGGNEDAAVRFMMASFAAALPGIPAALWLHFRLA